ncbi:hypothetical protein EGW08_019135 [Elysia chlorotica]|uniref:Endonuclease/exonuclease/phosphatase domain-containing protein n=1 Tax=Elysia chlorotica TaxID=188477 RepID=A0A433SV02_ELYCH|nr:hypothetical protein EGW08_019135 [Elysia chlorotica]
MTTLSKLSRYGARPVVTAKAGAVPGPQPRKGPPSTTGGSSDRPCEARRSGSKATGKTKDNALNIMHWNAEGVNSKRASWGYDHMDHRGEEIENWQDENNLLLINQPTDAPTFYSRSWHTTSTPDLAFCTGNLHGNITRTVGDQLGGSDHRPIYLQLQGTSVHKNKTPPRWNYKKANWMLYKHRTSILASQIETKDKDINKIVKDFNACILKAAKEAIPRGARKNYKPYWTQELQKLQDEVEETRKEVETNPNQQNHNFYQAAKAKFQRSKTELQRSSWKEKTKSLNFEKDGKKLWRLTKQLNDETDRGNNISLVENNDIISGKKAADYLARQFAEVSNIQIGPEQRRNLTIENERLTTSEPPDIMTSPLTEQELTRAISKLKKHKSPGSDGITNEMIINLGTPARKKLLEIFNISWESDRVQNQALRIITGGMRSTPIQQMEKITGIQPLKERRDTKIIQQAQKFLCTEDSAMKGRMKDLARGRLKRSSFVHQAKRLRKGLKDMPSNVLPLTYIPEQTP